MVNATEALSLILVGALWGCTNPFMRKGFVDTKKTDEEKKKGSNRCDADGGFKSLMVRKLGLLANVKVWLPYLVNQVGSLMYYKTLASSNLTHSVPICNATAMVFSSITSAILGEKVNQPGKATLGVVLVLTGVAICMHSSEEGKLADIVDDGGGGIQHREL
mmetsp:Transcript_12488/g.30530  ORF Transcript_12488/g.30530 Transcript_12488/m.30530 type:complete len:162 (+) Transcript_12488:98-583(+)|eukprot:CAMPEP_0181087428 /NCGR_PEP_ID=MMETSP1071-20121207/6265_1 /TAXON_ID=35127 /ORGANISM="Thalassiosira sp., Strain NH16" /LENGTH=161 /DNA_ID=CAMNT_0023169311 /DNA_START=37 /DNA_END=522 /DNA_ORIENTATION=+